MLTSIRGYLCVLFLCSCFLLAAQQPDLVFTNIGASFSKPVDIANDGVNSDRLYVVEKNGRIKLVDLNTGQVTSTYLNLVGQVSTNSERGLLGLAFHPDFANNGHFFVNYTNTSGTTVVARYTAASASATTINTGTQSILLTISQPAANHNGGDLAFGTDGYLYISTGDGGGGGDPDETGQDLQSLLGKMLRIDVDQTSPPLNYAIPPSNPFVGNASSRDEIWALGLRNPWRFSFDRQTGDMWIADVGQSTREEINFQPAASSGGENYGWDCYEGSTEFELTDCGPQANYVGPIVEMPRTGNFAARSITGGYVYRGSDTDLQGWYIAADYATYRFFLIRPDGSGGWTTLPNDTTNIEDVSTFGESLDGELFVAEYVNGQVYQITSSPLPVTLIAWRGRYVNERVELHWATAMEQDAQDFRIERSADGRTFQEIGRVPASGNSQQEVTYAFTDEQPYSGFNYYRLRQVDFSGQEELSDVIRIHTDGQIRPRVLPNPSSGQFSVQVGELERDGRVDIQLYDLQGQLVFTQSWGVSAGWLERELVLPYLPRGAYQLRLVVNGEEFRERIVLQ